MSCGCDRCCGDDETPEGVAPNRPGRSALSYRAGTHTTFLDAMRARLSSKDHPALAALSTHDLSDPSVAMLDAWAVVGDVLTFYQERIANEGYLRTATERRSLVEQARLVGYRPRPGVAASTYLAYTVDANAAPVTIPAGARVNTVPGPGEQMQAFETSADLQARPEWNELTVRTSRPQTGASLLRHGLYLAGTDTRLAPGDALLVGLGVGIGEMPFRVAVVDPQPDRDRTRVELRGWFGGDPFRAVVPRLLDGLVLGEVTDVDTTLPAVQRAQDVLGEVRSLGSDGSLDELAAMLAIVLPELLGQDLETLPGATAGWLRTARQWLAVLYELLAPVAQPVPPDDDIREPRAPDPVTPAELLDRLGAPPSVPPRGPQSLRRTSAGTFGARGDVYPELVAALRPLVRPGLYGALANAAPGSAGPDDQVDRRITVTALRQAVRPFGATARPEPQYDLETGGLGPQPWTDWAAPAADEGGDVLFLDRSYPDLLADTPIVVTRPAGGGFPPYLVTSIRATQEVSRDAYGTTGPSTRLTIGFWWRPVAEGDRAAESTMGVLRGTVAYVGAQDLPLADAAVSDAVAGTEVELDRLHDGLRSGRWMVLSGIRSDVPGTAGVRADELVMLAGVTHRVATVPVVADVDGDGELDSLVEAPLPGDRLHTYLTLATPPAYTYERGTVVLRGNVVHATHGETRQEVLGAGDATTPLQTFALSQGPLTYVSAPTPSGVASTLTVRVAEVRWDETASVATVAPDDRAYMTGQDDDGRTTVVFGDGEHGARLPTGQDNVRAVYRTGIGASGNVRAGQASLLATVPLGVTGVTNPLRATGGADRDGADDIRRRAPLAVTALDRLVSVSDYADFARTFGGIAKARADRLTDGTRMQVLVTVAGVADAPLDDGADVVRDLAAALRRFGDPQYPVRVMVRELLALVVDAGVAVADGYAWDEVVPRVRTAVRSTFGFGRRELGQDVLNAEMIAAIQTVRGVGFVDLNVLRAVDEAGATAGIVLPTGGPSGPAALVQPPLRPARVEVLPAGRRPGADGVRPAQLAYLLPDVQDTLILNEVRP